MMGTTQITHLNKQPIIVLLYAKAVFNAIIATVITTIKPVIKPIIKPIVKVVTKIITKFITKVETKPLTNSGEKSVFTQQYSICAQQVNLRNLNRYLKCCGFNKSTYLPATYPFVTAFPLLIKLMTSKKFPVSILGLIHYKNRIVQHHPIKQDAVFTILCHLSNDSISVRGRCIETQIDIYVEGQLMWQCTSTFIQRSAKPKSNQNSPRPKLDKAIPEALNKCASTPFESFNIGTLDSLKYAYISRDLNPIHLHHIGAKVMGLKTTIMHGMYAKARILAQLETVIDIQQISIDVQFKSAIFLPAQICLNVALSQQNNTFNLLDTEQRVTHLSGVISPLLNRMN